MKLSARDPITAVRVLLVTALALLALAAPAHAAFAGANGQIAFVRGGDIWIMNPDGSGQVNLTNSPATEDMPSWSADGKLIAYQRGGEVWKMMADGSGQQQVPTTLPGYVKGNPTWSPSGSQIAFAIDGRCEYGPNDENGGVWKMNADGSNLTVVGCTQGVNTEDRGAAATDWSPDGSKIVYRSNLRDVDIYTLPADGSAGLFGATNLTNSTGSVDDNPDWSPDGNKIVWQASPNGFYAIWTMNSDGTGQVKLTTSSGGELDPVWSPDGKKIAYVTESAPIGIHVINPDGSGDTFVTSGSAPSWQPINAYPRPKGATPMRIALVTANQQCTSPNTTHGAPLVAPSCAPVALTSNTLTVGTGDSNARPALMQAFIRLDVMPGNPTTPANEADVKVQADINDVFNKDLSDYTGGLRASIPVQITDKDNPPGVAVAGTTQALPFEFDIGCTATADTSVGSDCALDTTFNALLPGAVTEQQRAVWELGQVKVYDGGADGNPDTLDDNTLFLEKGVFVP